METIFFPLDDDDLGIEEHDLDSYCYVLVKQNDGIAEPPVVCITNVYNYFLLDDVPFDDLQKEDDKTCIVLSIHFQELNDTYIYNYEDDVPLVHDEDDEDEVQRKDNVFDLKAFLN